MRKFFTASTAVLLSAGMAFNSLAAVKLDAPIVRWSTDGEAIPEFSSVDGAGGEYRFQAYKDSEMVDEIWESFGILDTNEWLQVHDWVNHLKDSGIYKFRVMALGAENSDTENSDWSDWSEEWTFEKPDIQFGVPTNLHWEGTTACWDAPEDSISSAYPDEFAGYEITLIADGQPQLTYTCVSETYAEFVGDDFNFMDEEAKYTFSARVISNTPSTIFHGDYVYGSDVYDTSDVSNEISNALNSIASSSDATQIASSVAELDKSKLATSMQANDDVADQIAELDSQYAAAANVTVEEPFIAEDTGISDVSVTGMALNADPDTSISFHVSKPEREAVVDETAYKNAIQFSFKVSNDGKNVSTLKVPMLIRIALPADYDETHFRILHYNSDNKTLKEVIIPRIENGYALFTVTSFSTFVFVEENSDIDSGNNSQGGSNNGSNGSNNGSNGSSNGGSHSGSSSSSGGSGSYNGRTRLYKSPVGGKWSKQTDGTYMYFYADGSLALDCWIELSGKWYHIDKNHLMNTGWFKGNGNWFYLNPASGAANGEMMTGWQKIDGKWYYLNEKSDGFKGALYANCQTPDGYTVDGNGAWIEK